jgi:hypothetical protein
MLPGEGRGVNRRDATATPAKPHSSRERHSRAAVAEPVAVSLAAPLHWKRLPNNGRRRRRGVAGAWVVGMRHFPTGVGRAGGDGHSAPAFSGRKSLPPIICLLLALIQGGSAAAQPGTSNVTATQCAALEPFFEEKTGVHLEEWRCYGRVAPVSEGFVVVQARAHGIMGLFVMEEATGTPWITLDLYSEYSGRSFASLYELTAASPEFVTLVWARGMPRTIRYYFDLETRSSTPPLPLDPLPLNIVAARDDTVHFAGAAIVVHRLRSRQPFFDRFEVFTEIDETPVDAPIVRVVLDQGHVEFVNRNHLYRLSDAGWTVTGNPERQFYRYPATRLDSFPEFRFLVPKALAETYAPSVELAGGGQAHILVWSQFTPARTDHTPPCGWNAVYVKTDSEMDCYPVPPPPFEIFQTLRPDRVEQGYTEDRVTLVAEIGPWSLWNGQLIFGLQYDSSTNGVT